MSPGASCSCTFFVAPLGASYMTQPGTDQYKGKVSVQEATHHTSTVDLPVQHLNESLFYTDLSTVIPLNDGGKGNSFEGNVPRGGEVSAVMATTIP